MAEHIPGFSFSRPLIQTSVVWEMKRLEEELAKLFSSGLTRPDCVKKVEDVLRDLRRLNDGIRSLRDPDPAGTIAVPVSLPPRVASVVSVYWTLDYQQVQRIWGQCIAELHFIGQASGVRT